ncbi:hypothetical protein [Staphylospora marina]|uniref:hypothetical protein n=1 Tax=Staphylospora marina TaxID=2490858 RepID=UPI000F5BB693|nr:hypothetical protein [Staphylospora marina]
MIRFFQLLLLLLAVMSFFFFSPVMLLLLGVCAAGVGVISVIHPERVMFRKVRLPSSIRLIGGAFILVGLFIVLSGGALAKEIYFKPASDRPLTPESGWTHMESTPPRPGKQTSSDSKAIRPSAGEKTRNQTGIQKESGKTETSLTDKENADTPSAQKKKRPSRSEAEDGENSSANRTEPRNEDDRSRSDRPNKNDWRRDRSKTRDGKNDFRPDQNP